jgi:hypothetical protein
MINMTHLRIKLWLWPAAMAVAQPPHPNNREMTCPKIPARAAPCFAGLFIRAAPSYLL